MNAYRLRLSRSVKRQVDRLPGNVRQRVRRLIDSLSQNPRPDNAKELRNLPGRYRIRLNGWRVIYKVDDNTLQVIILAVKYKRGPETYMRLE